MTSRGTAGRPRPRRRLFQRQNNRKPRRCQAITVSGFTAINTSRQRDQRRASAIQRSRSPARSCVRRPRALALKHEHLMAKREQLRPPGQRDGESSHERQRGRPRRRRSSLDSGAEPRDGETLADSATYRIFGRENRSSRAAWGYRPPPAAQGEPDGCPVRFLHGPCAEILVVVVFRVEEVVGRIGPERLRADV